MGNADSTVTPESRGVSHVALSAVLGRALAAPDAVTSSRQPAFETIAKNAAMQTCCYFCRSPLSHSCADCGLLTSPLCSDDATRSMNAFAKSFALRCALDFFTIFSRQACALYALAVRAGQ